MEWDLLKGVPGDRVRELLAGTRRRRFARREVLFHAGDPAASVHLVAKGRLAVRITTPLGDVATLHVVVAGDVLGEMALLAPGGVRSATAIALAHGDPDDRCLDLHRYPPVGARPHRGAGRPPGGSGPAAERPAVGGALRPGGHPAPAPGLGAAELYGTDIPLTQEDFAGLAGATRATVNRVLRREEKAGTLVLGRGRVSVVDPKALARRSR